MSLSFGVNMIFCRSASVCAFLFLAFCLCRLYLLSVHRPCVPARFLCLFRPLCAVDIPPFPLSFCHLLRLFLLSVFLENTVATLLMLTSLHLSLIFAPLSAVVLPISFWRMPCLRSWVPWAGNSYTFSWLAFCVVAIIVKRPAWLAQAFACGLTINVSRELRVHNVMRKIKFEGRRRGRRGHKEEKKARARI